MRRFAAGAIVLLVGLVVLPGRLPAQSPAHREIKYVRDSEEYPTLMRQIYRIAARTVVDARRGLRRGQVWAVVLDIDETAVDNSVYQLERAAYRLPFDEGSWNDWVRREQAPATPGVIAFLDTVRAAGARVAWISNHSDLVRGATRANLERVGLWRDGDLLCLKTDSAYTKARRRSELRSGEGACAWKGTPVTVLAYVGDQMGDFPQAGEDPGVADRDSAFGSRYFLLPDPLYGKWER